MNERLWLSLLSPEIIQSILNGTQPEGLTMQWLNRNSFPSDWGVQHRALAHTQCDINKTKRKQWILIKENIKSLKSSHQLLVEKT